MASQFNCLEFVSARVTPEDGVTGYANDPTQGPACAIAVGAATVYRNYFARVGPDGLLAGAPGSDEVLGSEDLDDISEGQTEHQQLNLLATFQEALGDKMHLVVVRNGYTFSSKENLKELGNILRDASELTLDRYRCCMRIGIQYDAEVHGIKLAHFASIIVPPRNC